MLDSDEEWSEEWPYGPLQEVPDTNEELVQYEANRYDHLYWPIPGTENEDLIPLLSTDRTYVSSPSASTDQFIQTGVPVSHFSPPRKTSVPDNSSSSASTLPLGYTLTMSDDEKDQLENLGYVVTRDLGEGVSGQVFHAFCDLSMTAWVPIDQGDPIEGCQLDVERMILLKQINIGGKSCALKRLINKLAFDNEKTIMMELHHRYLVQIYTTFELNGQYYIAMEYMKGDKTLMVYLLQFLLWVSLDEFTALLIIKHITLGLQYIHSRGIAHLDLHSGNIMAQLEDRQMIWKIVDFGCAARPGDPFFNQKADLYDYVKIVQQVLNLLDTNSKVRKDVEAIINMINLKGCQRGTRQEREKTGVLHNMQQIADRLLPILPDLDIPLDNSAADWYVKTFMP